MLAVMVLGVSAEICGAGVFAYGSAGNSNDIASLLIVLYVANNPTDNKDRIAN